MRSTG